MAGGSSDIAGASGGGPGFVGAAGLPGVVRERRYTGAAAFFHVEGDDNERFEVLAEPDAAKVGERVYVEATRVIVFPEGNR